MEVIDMEVNYRNPKIYLLSGKARHGKDTIAGYLKEFYEKDGKKVIFSRAGKYIKFYAMEMTGWDGSEETKPRTLLQELGTDVIRNKLNKAEMFIDRQIDDIEIYSYFYDAIIVELGEAIGDNWWCVVYPPLCFVEAKQLDTNNIVYKSKLLEIIRKFFD